jgi:hypothetical protein
MRIVKLAIAAALTIAPITGVVLASTGAASASTAPAAAHAHPSLCLRSCT